MSDLLSVTRQQLAAFIRDPRSIKSFELLFQRVTQIHPQRTQYASPGASGFTVDLVNVIDTVAYDLWLLLTPAANYAAGTINLPPAATCVDRQIVGVTSTKSVTNITIGLNGATAAIGAPSTLGVNGTFKLCYDQPATTWYVCP